MAEQSGGKRVGWVELYFDLVFVFAVSQVAHAVVAAPRWGGVGAALGLFATLWWTWIGFVVLYNRHGDDHRAADRVFVLAGTVPCAVAATQAHHVFEGRPAGFALALAGARVVLATAATRAALRPPRAREHRRVAWGYGLSLVVFAVSAAAPRPWCYVLWAFALVQEGGFLLLGEQRERRRERVGLRRANRDAERRPTRTELLRSYLRPGSAEHAVDAGHLAERFGLFMIILLGELVITVGAGALDRPVEDGGYWAALVGGLVLAGALWWVYFDSAAEVNERLLTMSGGNPALANSLYAAGHLAPAFSLLVVAAGVNLSLRPEPPVAASWLVAGGLAGYLGGVRAFAPGRRAWYAVPLRLIAPATVLLGLLRHLLSAPGVVVVAACWAVLAAAAVTVLRRDALRGIEEWGLPTG